MNKCIDTVAPKHLEDTERVRELGRGWGRGNKSEHYVKAH